MRQLVLLLASWAIFATPGRALLCFHCNSAGRPGCADPFDADALEPLACDPPPHPDAETLDASLQEGGPANATPLADALYFGADAPPVVRCLKEERAVSETASVVLRTCVLVAEDTPEFGCSPHPAALHCSLCAEDECNAAAALGRLPPPLLMAVVMLLSPRC